MPKFLIAFDIPTKEKLFKKKIYQILKKTGAKMTQRSLWESENLNELLNIAILIKNIGGKVYVFEAKVLFS
jgi:CRISPR-associated endonuclease Cas2